MKDMKVTRKDRAKDRQNPVGQMPNPITFCMESGAGDGMMVLKRTKLGLPTPSILLPTAHMSFAWAGSTLHLGLSSEDVWRAWPLQHLGVPLET